MSKLIEEWRPIKDYEGLYEVSDWGRVRSLDHVVKQKNWVGRIVETHYKGKMLTHGKQRKNYWRITLCKNNVTEKRFLHQMVAEAFIPNHDNKPCIDHIDGDPSNNCVWNLRWCTTLENNNNPVTLKRLSEAKKGYTNRAVRKVARCDDYWNILQIYDSMKDARRKGFCNVYNAIYNSKTHYSGGYLWKFL